MLCVVSVYKHGEDKVDQWD